MLGVVPAASVGVIFSNNFDSEHGGAGALNFSSFTNWNVTQDTVDLIGNGFFDFYPGHGLYIDMDGSTNQNGGLTSKQIFAPGNYTLSFNLAGSARGDTPGLRFHQSVVGGPRIEPVAVEEGNGKG